MDNEPIWKCPQRFPSLQGRQVQGRQPESMRGGNRFFIRGVVNHIYQRPIEPSVIFYNISDYLVYFTILCSLASKYELHPKSWTQIEGK